MRRSLLVLAALGAPLLLAACETGGTGAGPASDTAGSPPADGAGDAAARGGAAGDGATGQETGEGGNAQALAALPEPEQGAYGVGIPRDDAPEPEEPIEGVPVIFLALQTADSGPVSAVFAVDEDGNGTPDNDNAIRISPENNDCNQQILTRFDFPVSDPIFDSGVVRAGVRLETLPDYLAEAVSRGMIQTGLAESRDDTLPQAICTRKIWQAIQAAQGSSGQVQG